MWNKLTQTDLDGLICVGNEHNEQAEHHVDEEGGEGVKIDSAEKPNHVAFLPYVQKGGVHVVPVNERKQAFGHFIKRPKLQEPPGKHRWGIIYSSSQCEVTHSCGLVLCHGEAQAQSIHRNSSRGRS